MKPINITIACFLALFFGFSTQKTNAQLEKLQSNYIINFAQHVQWPSQEKQFSFRIGVFGEGHPIFSALKKRTNGGKIGGKTVEIIEFKSIEELSACHVLFIPNSQLGQLKKISKVFLGVPVLIITESQDFLSRESNINIYVENDKLGYNVV